MSYDGHTTPTTPNVEVTGAARLYRAASVWTAGLGVVNSLNLYEHGTIGSATRIGIISPEVVAVTFEHTYSAR